MFASSAWTWEPVWSVSLCRTTVQQPTQALLQLMYTPCRNWQTYQLTWQLRLWIPRISKSAMTLRSTLSKQASMAPTQHWLCLRPQHWEPSTVKPQFWPLVDWDRQIIRMPWHSSPTSATILSVLTLTQCCHQLRLLSQLLQSEMLQTSKLFGTICWLLATKCVFMNSCSKDYTLMRMLTTTTCWAHLELSKSKWSKSPLRQAKWNCQIRELTCVLSASTPTNTCWSLWIRLRQCLWQLPTWSAEPTAPFCSKRDSAQCCLQCARSILRTHHYFHHSWIFHSISC